MKIFTVNMQKEYVKLIEYFVGEDKIYPSRSEFIRAAIENYLKEYFKMLDEFVDEFERRKEMKIKRQLKEEPVVIDLSIGEPNKRVFVVNNNAAIARTEGNGNGE